MSYFYNQQYTPFVDPFYNFLGDIANAVDQVHQAIGEKAVNNKRVAKNEKGANAVSKIQKKQPERADRDPEMPLISAFDNDPFFSSNMDVDKFTPELDVHENDKEYTLKVSVPGAAKDNLSINFNKDDNLLTIEGEIPSTKTEEKNGDKVIHTEIRSGKFERSMTLPRDVNADGIKAGFENGILTLRVPKSEKTDNVKSIDIN
ncbi:DEBR0S1_13894g1_1 [Brettanomyces bruxellensis]|uniref:DEBR0S1_13894g1_1 n=1 Tax=Dekkera bruxellensis TaxID=5007 RepID=A0A7D9GYS0_DEKBR|nr:uncharacterized protein BRETT_002525 [Brettanomyces bruxellensis]QOU22348.1 hypothetical protein BRETT_002525 [Brettanomyces bruxellensis]VUG16328.1 DEBR0S1_13894g1_1 [Brettanomyces bruxellensis]